MTFDDFVMHFTEISVCHLLNTSVFTFSRRWYGSVFYGGWTSGVRGSAADRAGGCVNHRESFLRNPQVLASSISQLGVQNMLKMCQCRQCLQKWTCTDKLPKQYVQVYKICISLIYNRSIVSISSRKARKSSFSCRNQMFEKGVVKEQKTSSSVCIY